MRKPSEIIAEVEAVKQHVIATPNERALAKALIETLNHVKELTLKIAKLEGSPLPPGSV